MIKIALYFTFKEFSDIFILIKGINIRKFNKALLIIRKEKSFIVESCASSQTVLVAFELSQSQNKICCISAFYVYPFTLFTLVITVYIAKWGRGVVCVMVCVCVK